MDLGSEKYGNVPNVNVMRLSFTGLSGFEFHLSNEHLYCLYDNIIKIARDNEFKVCDFGAYALDSMRMEVGFKFLGSDMRRDDTAVMCSPLNNSTNNSTNNMTVTEAQSSNGIEQQRSYAVSPLNSTAEVQSSNAVEPQRSYAVSPLISTAEVQSSNAVEPQRSYAASPSNTYNNHSHSGVIINNLTTTAAVQNVQHLIQRQSTKKYISNTAYAHVYCCNGTTISLENFCKPTGKTYVQLQPAQSHIATAVDVPHRLQCRCGRFAVLIPAGSSHSEIVTILRALRTHLYTH
eukprot:22506_1